MSERRPCLPFGAMRAFHLTWSTDGRQPAFPEESRRRGVLRAIATSGGESIILFALVDDHVHIVVYVDPVKLPMLVRSLSTVLTNRAAVPLAPTFVREVESRQHLRNLVDYCLTQISHHGLPWSAATDTGSCFPDLVGARRIPGMQLPIARALPRLRLREAYNVVGLPPEALEPASDDTLRALGAVRLAELTAETFALGPGLDGNEAAIANARKVFATLAVEAGFRLRDIAHALDVSPSAAARLVRRAVDAKDTRAVRLRVALEMAVRSRK